MTLGFSRHVVAFAAYAVRMFLPAIQSLLTGTEPVAYNMSFLTKVNRVPGGRFISVAVARGEGVIPALPFYASGHRSLPA